jgi:hypothetical protein
MVQAWPFGQLSRSALGYPRWASNPLTVGGGHKQALAPLLVLLLVGTFGGAFTSILVLVCLTSKDVSAKALRSQQVRARALVLAAVVASTMTWVVATASPFPRITIGTPVGVEGVVCVMVEAETLMYWI